MTPTARHRWMGSYLAVACGGSVVVLTAAGLGAGLPYAVETADAGQIGALVGAALAYLPAVVLLVGVAAALYGLAPRAVSAVWVVVTSCFVIGFLGQVLKLPRWLVDLSPFQHTPAPASGEPDAHAAGHAFGPRRGAGRYRAGELRPPRHRVTGTAYR